MRINKVIFKNLTLTFFFSIVCFNLFSQSLNKVDSCLLQLSKKKYVSSDEIIKHVNDFFLNDRDRYEIYFKWIATNLKYNEYVSIKEPDRIFKQKTASCQGYSALLKYFCDKSAIECVIIDGYSKGDTKDINNIPSPNHTWNAVKIEHKWYLSDVTFASLKGNKGKVIYEFDENYFLCSPPNFILEHFPKENKYQFLPKFVKKNTFLKWPFFYSKYFTNNFTINTKRLRGIVRRKVLLEFLNFQGDEKLFILTDGIDTFPIKVINKNGKIVLNINAIKTNEKKLTLYYNEQAIMGFKKL